MSGVDDKPTPLMYIVLFLCQDIRGGKYSRFIKDTIIHVDPFANYLCCKLNFLDHTVPVCGNLLTCCTQVCMRLKKTGVVL